MPVSPGKENTTMDNSSKTLTAGANINYSKLEKKRTTIGLKQITKGKLDKYRAPGQCYDGFICQLVDLWKKSNGNYK